LFKKKKLQMIIATDVAARGIDVNDITHVINFSLPQDPESYIHRVGRTGRAGKTGIAITLVSPLEFRKLAFFQKATNTTIKKGEIPGIENIIDAKKKKLKTSLENIIEKESHTHYLKLAEELLADKDATHILAAMLKITYANEFNPETYNKIEQVHTSTEGKQRLFVALGRKAGYYAKSLVDYITQETGVESRDIDDVRVLDDFSFITVPLLQAETIIKIFERKHKGERPIITKAKEDKRNTEKNTSSH
jgi:ATP-dependent RNA helicase DeaD